MKRASAEKAKELAGRTANRVKSVDFRDELKHVFAVHLGIV